MSLANTSADWHSHHRACPDCGARYHASEGGCSCEPTESASDYLKAAGFVTQAELLRRTEETRGDLEPWLAWAEGAMDATKRYRGTAPDARRHLLLLEQAHDAIEATLRKLDREAARDY